jgi:hypothetical protein
MSFVLTVWETPAGAPAPATDRDADLLLERQQAMPDVPSRRMAAFVETLHERFPPDSEGFGEFVVLLFVV